MSEKKIVSFFRLAATLVVCVPVKIELYNCAGRNLANLDDKSARSSFFSVSSICVHLSSINPVEMAIIANRTTSQLRLIAHRLLASMERHFARAGVTRFRLFALAANTQARTSYEGAGFAPYEILYEKLVGRPRVNGSSR